MESGVKHICYTDCIDHFIDLERHYGQFRGKKLIYRINTRSHGDYDDNFVDVVARIVKRDLFKDLKSTGSSIRVINQLQNGNGEKGYFLEICPLVHTSINALTSSEIIFILIDLEKGAPRKQYKEMKGDVLSPWSIAGYWEPVESGFQ